MEKNKGSTIYKTDEDYVSVSFILKPVIFERQEKEIPNLLVSDENGKISGVKSMKQLN